MGKRSVVRNTNIDPNTRSTWTNKWGPSIAPGSDGPVEEWHDEDTGNVSSLLNQMLTHVQFLVTAASAS